MRKLALIGIGIDWHAQQMLRMFIQRRLYIASTRARVAGLFSAVGAARKRMYEQTINAQRSMRETDVRYKTQVSVTRHKRQEHRCWRVGGIDGSECKRDQYASTEAEGPESCECCQTSERWPRAGKRRQGWAEGAPVLPARGNHSLNGHASGQPHRLRGMRRSNRGYGRPE